MQSNNKKVREFHMRYYLAKTRRKKGSETGDKITELLKTRFREVRLLLINGEAIGTKLHRIIAQHIISQSIKFQNTLCVINSFEAVKKTSIGLSELITAKI